MAIANHTTSTSCVARCTCGADLTNEVHDAKADVEAADKRLIALRNSGVSEQEIQDAQEARHVAQERYDAAFKSFVEFTNEKDMKIARVDEEEAVLSDDEDEDDSEEEDDEESGSELGTAAMLAEGDSGDDDEEDGEFKL